MTSERNLDDFVIGPSATIVSAAGQIERNHARTVVVVERERVVGVFSDGDIIRALLRGTDVHAPIESFVHPDFKYLHERNLAQALALFRRHGFCLVPVVDREFRLLDVITVYDVLAVANIGNGK